MILIIFFFLFWPAAKPETHKAPAQVVNKILINEDMLADGGGGDGGRKNYAMWFHNLQTLADPHNGNNFSVDTMQGIAGVTMSGDTRDPEILYRPYNFRILEYNLQSQTHLKFLYGLVQQTSGYPDTMDIFLSRTAGPPWYNKLKSNLRDSTPNYRIIHNGLGPTTWRQLAVMDDTAQYIMVVIRYRDFLHPVDGYPIRFQCGYSDILFYGEDKPGVADETTYNYISEEEVDALDAVRYPMKNFSGTNLGNNHGPVTAYKDSEYARWYRPLIYWEDAASGKYPDNIFAVQPQQDGSSYNYHWKQVQLQNPSIINYPAIGGPTKWVQFSQFGTDQGYGAASVDSIGMNLAEPSSYRGSGHAAFYIGTAHGFDENADTSLVTVTGGPKLLADSLLTAIQMGNENDNPVFPGLFRRPIEQVAHLVAVYDGDQGRLPAGVGVKNADPSMKVFYMGHVGWNYRPMLATVRWNMYARGERSVSFDAMMGHVYYANYFEQPYLTQQNRVYGHGVHPAENGSIDTLRKMHRKLYKWAGFYIPYGIDENGWDKTFARPQNTDQIFNTTSYGVPHIDSYTAEECQGILLSVSMIYHWQTSSNAMVQFWGVDNVQGSQNSYENSGIWFNHFTGYEYTHTTYYPGFFTMNGQSKRIGEYVHEATLSPITWGGLYVFKGRHQVYTDSVCYIIGKADTLSGAGIAYDLDVTNRIGSVKEWPLSFTTLDPTETTPTISNNEIAVTAMVLPKFFTLKEGSLPAGENIRVRGRRAAVQ